MPPNDSLILTFDIGTSSTRTALFDSGGNRVPETTFQQKYDLVTSAEGAAELEPGNLLSAAAACLEGTLKQLRTDRKLRGRTIAGIGVSCFWHSLIGVRADYEPLTRIVTWADARCAPDAAKLRSKFSEREVHRRTGCMLRASFWPAKLAWLKRTQPRLFKRVARWVSPAEWLQTKMAGHANCAIGMASGTGLLDQSKLTWDAELLRHCSVSPEMFGELSDAPTETAGMFADKHPELRGVPWFPGIGDGAASNLGSGATRPGFAAINFGTSGAFRIMREGRVARAPFGLFCYRVDAKRFLVGGAISNAGNLRAWCVRELGLSGDQTVEEELARRTGPTHGLTVLPFWSAERAPTWNEDLRGAILGLTQNTTALDLLQAATEATYHRLAQIEDLVLADEQRMPKVLVSGGIQHSQSAMQRLADVLGKPIYANPEPEASIRGAAVYALEKLGLKPDALVLQKPLRPKPKAAKLYAEARKRQTGLETLLEKHWSEMVLH